LQTANLQLAVDFAGLLTCWSSDNNPLRHEKGNERSYMKKLQLQMKKSSTNSGKPSET